MEISKVIKKLQKAMDRHGDIQVYKSWEWYEEDMVGSVDEAVNNLKVETRRKYLVDEGKHKVVVIS